MKYLVIVLAVFLSLVSLGLPAHCEENNPYPPPPQTTDTGATAMMSRTDRATPSGAEIIADLVLCRPFSMAALGVGIATGVVAAPFILPHQTAQQAYQELLGKPFDFAVRRPLGEDTETEF